MQQTQLTTQPSRELAKETSKDLSTTTTGNVTTVTPNLDWQLKEPEKINTGKLENKNWAEAAKFSEERLKILKQIPDSVKGAENEFLGKEKEFLEKTLIFLHNYAQATKENLEDEAITMKKLEEDIAKFDPEKKTKDAAVKEAKAKVDGYDKQIIDCRNEIFHESGRKAELAGKIDPKELRSIKIKDSKSKLHTPFVWILGVIYGEAQSKYDWSNFKKQAFKADGGVDFTERLKGFNYQKMKIDPVITRRALEEKDAIFQELESKKGSVPQSLRALYDYINMIKKISDASEAIKAHELELSEAKQNFEKVTTSYNETLSKIEEIESKLKIVKKYHTSMEKIKNLVNNCLEITEERANVQGQYTQAVGGNAKAISNMNNLSRNQSQPGHATAQGTAGHEEKGKQSNESPFKNEQTKDQGFTGQTGAEEEEFGGEGQDLHAKTKAEVRSGNRPETDINEEPLAPKKEGGCEGCNIF